MHSHPFSIHEMLRTFVFNPFLFSRVLATTSIFRINLVLIDWYSELVEITTNIRHHSRYTEKIIYSNEFSGLKYIYVIIYHQVVNFCTVRSWVIDIWRESDNLL